MTPRAFFSYTLMSVGALTSVLAGGCSLLALTSLDDEYINIVSISIVGGVPFIVGMAVYYLGKYLKPTRDDSE